MGALPVLGRIPTTAATQPPATRAVAVAWARPAHVEVLQAVAASLGLLFTPTRSRVTLRLGVGGGLYVHRPLASLDAAAPILQECNRLRLSAALPPHFTPTFTTHPDGVALFVAPVGGR